MRIKNTDDLRRIRDDELARANGHAEATLAAKAKMEDTNE